MTRAQKSTALYAHPFSKAYWRDAAAELKDTKMLVVTALMVALRIVLKPFAIYIAPQVGFQTAMLATVLGAAIFGPVVAIPAAMVSDTIGFILFPTGTYFLPFMLTEIASTMIYALLLYRADVSSTRVILSRFFICLFVNILLQQGIMAWQAIYMGTPEEAWNKLKDAISLIRIFKNLCFFPIESVLLIVFLRYLLPLTRRAKLTYCSEEKLRFNKKTIITLVALLLTGVLLTVGYLDVYYGGLKVDALGIDIRPASRSASYTAKQRETANKDAAQLVLDRTDDWDDQTVVCIVDSAYRGLFENETDYTVSVYILNGENFAAGQAADKAYCMDTLWGYSKSGPKNDPYGSLTKVATVTVEKNEKTGEILSFACVPVTVPA